MADPTPYTIRLDELGELDEVLVTVGGAYFHLERMDHDMWWLGVSGGEGRSEQRVVLRFTASSLMVERDMGHGDVRIEQRLNDGERLVRYGSSLRRWDLSWRDRWGILCDLIDDHRPRPIEWVRNATEPFAEITAWMFFGTLTGIVLAALVLFIAGRH